MYLSNFPDTPSIQSDRHFLLQTKIIKIALRMYLCNSHHFCKTNCNKSVYNIIYCRVIDYIIYLSKL